MLRRVDVAFLLTGAVLPALGAFVAVPALQAVGGPREAVVGAVVGLWVGAALLAARGIRSHVRGALDDALTRLDEGLRRGDAAGAVEAIDPVLRPVFARLQSVLAQVEVAGQAIIDRRELQQVIDSMPDSLLVLNQDGVVELANATSARRLGFGGPHEVVGLGLDALAGEVTPGWWQTLQADGAFTTRDVRLRSRTGNVVTFSAAARVFERVGSTRSAGVLVARESATEVNLLTQELAATAERLEVSERFFQDLFDAMEDPITVLSPDFEILQANRQAKLVFGRDLIGRRCYRAFRMRDTPCEDCPARETFAASTSVSVEHRIFGNAITRISTYPLLGKDGQVQAVINHKRDVTKERQLEDLKASFLATVSHELRTPLTSIMGFNKLNIRRLQRFVRPWVAEGPEEVRTALQKALSDMEVMGSEGERLGRLVNDVLDLSKLEAGKLRLAPESFEVLPLVQGAVTATSSLLAGRHLLVLPDVPEITPAAWGDRDRISQVLVNLLSNAIKYTARGEVRVAVVVESKMVRFVVQDSGEGIAPEDLPFIFERFRQAGDNQKGKPAGTGLGLAICKQIIQLHGGEITVESRVGHGSTFAFTVPRADASTRDSLG